MMTVMTLIGSGTSLEGDRWVLGRDGHDGDSYAYLEVDTPNGHHSKGGYGSPPLAPGWRLETCTQHHDLSPNQIILGLGGDEHGDLGKGRGLAPDRAGLARTVSARGDRGPG
jgi:hypothetical protein